MKKLALGLMIAGGAIFTGGLVADAYPPLSPAVAVSNVTPVAGEILDVTVTDCEAGEDVDFELDGATDSDVCTANGVTLSLVLAAPTSGTAVGNLPAPAQAGPYTGTAFLNTTNVTLPFNIVVQADTGAPTTTVAGELPATGSSGIGTTTTLAIGLFAAGLGLLLAARFRQMRMQAS